jgi:hypothetical protein
LLVRLLGLLSPSRVGRGPKDSRLIPDVDNLVTCLVPAGVSSVPTTELAAELPTVLFLLLMVTLIGM